MPDAVENQLSAAAECDCGVVVTGDGSVDGEATRRLRTTRVRENVRADFDFGRERGAWEAVFDDETMCELNRRLYALPKSVRREKRHRIFSQAVPNLPPTDGAPVRTVLADADAVRARLRSAMDEAFAAATP